MKDLEEFLMLILAISLASERLVEIIKGFFLPNLSLESPDDPKAEGRRRATICLISICTGIVSALLTGVARGDLDGQFMPYLAAGILSSAGSAFWNSVVGYLGQLKKAKQAEVHQKELTVRRELKIAALTPAAGE